jgi:endo-1,4-beta-xylanase
MPGFAKKGDSGNVEHRPKYTPIKDLFARKGLGFGLIRSASYTALEKSILKRECSQFPIANFVCPNQSQSTQGVWNYSSRQAMYDFCVANNLPIYNAAHLVWHGDNPAWWDALSGASTVRAMIRTQMDNVIPHYPAIRGWNVVNECFWYDAASSHWRQSQYYAAFGANWPAEFFTYARTLAPNAELSWNENHTMDNGANGTAVFNATLLALRTALDAGAPINSFGWQMHMGWDIDGAGDISAGQQVDRLNQIAALGLDIRVTELDVHDRNSVWPLATRRADQVAYVESYLGAIIRQVPRLKSVTMWSLTDNDNWLDVGANGTRTDGLKGEFCAIDRAGWVKKEWHQMFDRITG